MTRICIVFLIFTAFIFTLSQCMFTIQNYHAIRSLFLATNGYNWIWKNSSYGQIWNITANSTYQDACNLKWQGLNCSDRGLQGIELESYGLYGSIPTSFFNNVSSLTYFDVSGNNLTGYIPTSIASAKGLEYFIIQSNSFYGTIPSSLVTLTNLTYIFCWNNSIAGTLPVNFGNLIKLNTVNHFFRTEVYLFFTFDPYSPAQIDFENNNLVGQIPSSLSKIASLQTIYFAFNAFTGTIPTSIYSLSKLGTLDISYNSLIGELSEQINIFLYNNLLLSVRFRVDSHRYIRTEIAALFSLKQ